MVRKFPIVVDNAYIILLLVKLYAVCLSLRAISNGNRLHIFGFSKRVALFVKLLTYKQFTTSRLISILQQKPLPSSQTRLFGHILHCCKKSPLTRNYLQLKIIKHATVKDANRLFCTASKSCTRSR